MNKVLTLTVGAALLLSSCGTYTGSGAYAGVSLGAILGSAIGGISDGPRGSDIGTIVGMAGGAIVGSAIGSAADKKAHDQVHEHYEKVQARKAQQQAEAQQNQNYGSGFDETNSGDDRIYDFNGSDYTSDYTAQAPVQKNVGGSKVEQLGATNYSPVIEVVNARFVDDNQDNAINRGELCKVIFEVYNRGNQTLYDVQPMVAEMTGNKHIYVSPGMHVESIAPGKGIRYTALVKADNSLKDGTAKICVSVVQGNNELISKVTEFNIPTRRK